MLALEDCFGLTLHGEIGAAFWIDWLYDSWRNVIGSSLKLRHETYSPTACLQLIWQSAFCASGLRPVHVYVPRSGRPCAPISGAGLWLIYRSWLIIILKSMLNCQVCHENIFYQMLDNGMLEMIDYNNAEWNKETEWVITARASKWKCPCTE